MSSLSSLVERSTARNRANLDRLAELGRRNDVAEWSPSPEAQGSLSTPTPTRPDRWDDPPATPSRDELLGLRERIPARHNDNGGGYGRAILERVARNYGVVE